MMARQVLWGVFSLLVLFASVVYINFTSAVKIEEALRDMGGDSMPVAPYAQKLTDFFNENSRWPTPAEIVLPDPPAGGLVHSVKLEPDGVLALTLPGRIWFQRPEVKVGIIMQLAPERFRWTSACLDAIPKGISNVIFQHCGRTSWSEVQEMQARAVAQHEVRLKKEKARSTQAGRS